MLYRPGLTAACTIVATLLTISDTSGQKQQQKKINFLERQESIKQRIERSKGKIRNKTVHEPPMISAGKSDLDDDEPVIGVALNKQARAYPLTMLFGGGGIFELLNDTCGGHPIAASW